MYKRPGARADRDFERFVLFHVPKAQPECCALPPRRAPAAAFLIECRYLVFVTAVNFAIADHGPASRLLRPRLRPPAVCCRCTWQEAKGSRTSPFDLLLARRVLAATAWGWGGMLYEPFSQNAVRHHAYAVSSSKIPSVDSARATPPQRLLQHDHGATRIPRSISTWRSGCR